jgi:prepilin peptidase CpaA
MIVVLHLLIASVFPLLVLIAALTDVTTYLIPNRLSATLAIAFFPAALLIGLSPATIGVCLLVGIAALLFGVAMFAAGWIGGGDAKLFAAAALWLGWPTVVTFLAWTAIAGGALAVTLLAARKATSPVLSAQGPTWIGRLLEPKGDVPYGVAIAFGALAAFPASAVCHATGLH